MKSSTLAEGEASEANILFLPLQLLIEQTTIVVIQREQKHFIAALALKG